MQQPLPKKFQKGLEIPLAQLDVISAYIRDSFNKLLESIKEGFDSALAQVMELMKYLKKMSLELAAGINNLPSFREILSDMAKATAKFGEYLGSPQFKEALRNAPGKALEQAKELYLKIEACYYKIQEIANLALNEASEAMKKAIDATIDYLLSIPATMKEGVKDMWTGIISLKDDPLQAFHSGLQNLGFTVQATTGIVNGCVGLKLARLLEELGEIEKAEEINRLLLKLFDKLLNSFQDVSATTNEWLTTLQQSIDSAFASGRQLSSKSVQG